MITKREMRSAFLQVLKNRGNLSTCKIMNGIANDMGLDEYDLEETLKYSGKPKFYTKFKRAKAFLLGKGLIERTPERRYNLTDAGRAFITTLD